MEKALTDMKKALVDIPIGEQISNSPPKERWSSITTNNFAQMTGRSSKGWKGYDYSHILKPELKEKGYSLTIHHDNPRENIGDKRFYKKALVATVKHKGQKIGNTVGYLHDNGDLELATEFASHISPLHRGKGLGVAMYEGIMSHAKNALDGKQVVGGVHSTMASKVHSALAKKHGLDYLPTANQNSKEYDLNKPVGEYDDKLAPYSYMLKAEELNKALADIPIGEKLSDSPPKGKWDALSGKTFTQMTGRSSKGWQEHNYSHLLKPELQNNGYTLSIHNDSGNPKIALSKAVVAVLRHKGKKIGHTVGNLHDDGKLELGTRIGTYISPLHRGKGLGIAMYEGIMSHAKNALNAKEVVGGTHSTSASKVHEAISKKHGMDYEADPAIYGSYGEKTASQLRSFGLPVPDKEKAVEEYKKRPTDEFDNKFAEYQYTLKSEKMNKTERIQNITNLLKTLKIIQPDKDTPSEPGYAYHITDSNNLHSIAESGLGTFKPWHGSEQDSWPDGATEKRNYFHSNIQGTLPFGNGKTAILRVNNQVHPVKKERGTGDLYSRKTVHPDNIELLTEHGWYPITKWSQNKIKPQIQLKFPFAKSLSKSSVEDTMHEFKEGTLRSGSKDGPKVTDRNQAIAIALNQSGESTKKSEHIWRNRPILKAKDAEELDQNTAVQALKLGDIKRAEEAVYNDYQRKHRLNAAAHHYKALGEALAKGHRNASEHHRLAYQGHMQALGLNGLESPPRVIMERIRQITDREPTRFKSHPADIFSI